VGNLYYFIELISNKITISLELIDTSEDFRCIKKPTNEWAKIKIVGFK
jgi:hypothetical protein